MRYKMTGAIASVALLSAMSVAFAQGRDREGPGGGGGGRSAPRRKNRSEKRRR